MNSNCSPKLKWIFSQKLAIRSNELKYFLNKKQVHINAQKIRNCCKIRDTDDKVCILLTAFFKMCVEIIIFMKYVYLSFDPYLNENYWISSLWHERNLSVAQIGFPKPRKSGFTSCHCFQKQRKLQNIMVVEFPCTC